MHTRSKLAALLLFVAAASGPASLDAQTHGPNAFRLHLELGEFGMGGSHTFHQIRGLGMDADSRIWTADHFNASIRIFSPDGRLIQETGGAGDGPGEFQHILVFGLSGQGGYVYDREIQRITWLDGNGHVTRTKPVTQVNREIFEAFNRWIPLQHGFYAVRSEVMGGGIRDIRPFDPNIQLLLMTEDEVIADTIFSHHRELIMYRYEGWPGLVNYVPRFDLPPGGSWAVSGDSLIATVDGVHGHIRLHRVTEQGTTPAGSHDLEWPPRRVSERELFANSVHALTPRHPGISTRELTLYAPEFESRVGGMVLEPTGRVWLRIQEWDLRLRSTDDPLVPEEEDWLVVDPTRGVVAEVRFPAGFRLMQVSGNRYLGVHRDEWEIESVQLYYGPVIGGR